AFLPIGVCMSVGFATGKRGRELVSCGPSGLYRWPIGEDAGRLSIGAPRRIPLPSGSAVASVGGEGHRMLVACPKSGEGLVLDLDDDAVRRPLPHPALSYGMLSPDARWAATAGWHSPMIKVWDARTGAPVEELKTGAQNAVFFSPDGRTMVTSLPG